MTEDPNPPAIPVKDRRHFDRTGERRQDAEVASDRPAQPGPGSAGRDPSAPVKSGGSRGGDRPGALPGGSVSDGPVPGTIPHGSSSVPENLADLAAGLSSSFSLLVARLAQEAEIYLGLVPYPGKETPEPDLDAARAMIDVLSMLQEKTRGNLDAEESRLLDSLLYAYRLEFVRRKSGGEAR